MEFARQLRGSSSGEGGLSSGSPTVREGVALILRSGHGLGVVTRLVFNSLAAVPICRRLGPS